MSTHDEGWESRANRLGAENARLQARVQEVEALEEEWRSEAMMWEGRLTAAEALAERLREALEADVKWFVKQWEFYMNCGQLGAAQEVSLLLDDARAAIAATPDGEED